MFFYFFIYLFPAFDKMAPPYTKKWCFTINNPTDADINGIKNLPASCIEYLVYGHEVGEEGTPHLQGFVIFKNRKHHSAVKKLFPRAHLEVARGNNKQASDYCKKEDPEPYEYGDIPSDPHVAGGRATKRKWEETRVLAKAGKIEEIDADFYVQYYQTLKKIKVDHMPPVDNLEGCCGVWIWGPSGNGKSHMARTEYPDYYLKAANKWWDGYQGEDNVILEDLGPEHKVLAHHLKLWLDKWDFIAETKGGAIRIRPKVLVITSQYPVEQVFPDDWLTQDAVRRRCCIVELNEKQY